MPDGGMLDLLKHEGGYQYQGTNFTKFPLAFSKQDLSQFIEVRTSEFALESLNTFLKTNRTKMENNKSR